MMNKIVLGGGIGGLSAAHYLLKKHPKSPVTLLEASGRLGGWIKTNALDDGTIFEQGPRTLRPKGEAGLNTLELLEELNLEPEIKPINSAHPAARNRLIYARGELHLLPSSVKGLFVKTRLLRKPIINYLLSDLFAPVKKGEDESLYDFVARRFGGEIGDYLISPMVCGICGGNAKELSVHFLMSTLFKYEQEHGGVIKGFLRDMWGVKRGGRSVLQERAVKERWAIYSFNRGIEVLPQALEKVLVDNARCDVRLNNKCAQIDFDDCIKVTLRSGEVIKADAVCSALPAQQLATVVSKQHPGLADLLLGIKSVSIAAVNLQYRKVLLKSDGFGFLVAPKEKLPLLGVIYDSCCFPQGDCTILTAMLGGYWFKEHFGDNPSDDFILRTAVEQIGNILNIQDKPARSQVHVLKDCIPQYTVGHKANLARVKEYIKRNNLRLSICGSSYDGVGVNDVILSAKTAVNSL